MNKKFCSNCNKITYYEDTLPVGCSHCLTPFAGSIASQIKPVQVVRPLKKVVARQIELEEEEIIPDEEYTPSNNFKVEIEVSKPKRERETLRGLALDKSERMKIERPREKVIKNKKKFEESWSQDFIKGNRQNSTEIGG